MRDSIDVGIDLGTSNSAIARYRAGKTELLSGPDGSVLVPSIVHVAADGTVAVGVPAASFRDSDPENTAVEFKRLMGTDERRPFPASGKALTPEELSAEVLRALARRIGDAPLRSAVVTVPAMFQLPQCEATCRAAALAGIEHAPLLQEPIAAAIAHAGSAAVLDGFRMVYDLGGGTFDVSLVRARNGRLQVLDHDGDNHLGGRDFDRVVVRAVADRVRTEGRLGSFLRTDPGVGGAYARLKVEAERVRLRLSETEQATFDVPHLANGPGGEPVGIRFTLEREELERLIHTLVMRTINLCNRLLSRHGLKGSQLKDVVMVGGPTLTPCVPRLLNEHIGVEARHVLDPMTIVAQGAALYASTERLPRSLWSAGAEQSSVTLTLAYETMTTNLRPLIAIRAEKAPPDATIVIRRRESEFESPAQALEEGKGIDVTLELLPGRLNVFDVVVSDAGGKTLLAVPAEFTILQGLSVGRPPLSQSIGVMLAGNDVSWYLRKGAILPARNTMTHWTTIDLRGGQSGDAVHVPVVQGESDRADRNKVIGVLRIHARQIARDLPLGSEVEVYIAVDESARTKARAYVPLLDQWFEDIVMLGMESKPGDEVARDLHLQRDRLSELQDVARSLEEEGEGGADERVHEIQSLLEEGDRDSVDLADVMVRRMTRELDRVEGLARRETIEASFLEEYARADEIVRARGEVAEQRLLADLRQEFSQALTRGDLDIAEAKAEAVDELKMTLMRREPEYWAALFEILVKCLQEKGLADKANVVIERGRREESMAGMQQVCMELVEMLPAEVKSESEVAKVISNVR